MDEPSPEVERLLDKAETLRSKGEFPTAEELCVEQPHLTEEVRRYLQAFQSLSTFLEPTRLDARAATHSTWQPDRIGSYEVIDEISHGGMGIVYRCRQHHPPRDVAVKVMQPGILSAEALERFRLEAEALGRLQDPGIAQIYEAGEADLGTGNQPYFVMELIRGLPLDAHAAANNLDEDARIRLLVKVCRAVEHAHRRGVIHRDLKPANILVDENGQPKILDFGVARLTDDQLDNPKTLRSIDGFLGSLPYASPQQATAKQGDGDARWDVYALGVIAYELLTGRRPHEIENRSLVEFIQAVSETPAPRLSTCGKRYSKDLEIVIAKALEIEANRRYQTISQLADDLERYLGGFTVIARPVSQFDRGWNWCRRHPWHVTAASLASVAITALGIAIYSWRQKVTAELDKRESQTRLVAAQESASENQLRANEMSRLLETAQRRSDSMRLLRIAAVCQDDPTLAQRWLDEYPEKRRGFVWNLLNHHCLRHQQHIIPMQPDFTFGLAFSSRADRIAVLGRELRFFDEPFRGEPVTRMGTKNHGFFAFSPNQTTAASSHRGTQIRLWNLATLEVTHVLPGHEALIRCGAYSPDGQRLVTASNDGELIIWNLESKQGKTIVTGDHLPIVSVRFTSDSVQIVGINKNGIVRRWDASSGQLIATIESAPPPCRNPVLSPDATRVAYADLEASVTICSTTSGEVLANLNDYRDRLFGYVFTPDGKHLAVSGNDRKIAFWELDRMERDAVVPLPGRARKIAFSADGSKMATVDGSHNLVVSDITNLTFSRPQEIAHTESTDIQFSPDGRVVAFAHRNGSVQILDPNDGRIKVDIPSSDGPVYAIRFIPSDHRIVIGSASGTLRVWDWENRTSSEFIGHKSSIRSIAVSPDGRKMLSASTDSILLWDITTRTCEKRIPVERVGVNAIVFVDQGKRFAFAGRDRRIHLWDIDLGEVGQMESEATGSIRCLALSKNGRVIAASGMDPTIRYYDIVSRVRIAESIGHVAAVNSMDFSPDGNLLVSASSDRSIRIWDTTTGDLQAIMRESKSAVNGVSFSPSGDSFVGCEDDPVIRFWESGTGEDDTSRL